MTDRYRALGFIALAACTASPAAASNISLSGLVVNICTLTPGAGTLGSEGDGVTLSSEGLLGAPATLAVIATGGVPTLSFTAPTLSAPSGFSGAPTTSMTISSGGGAPQLLTTNNATRALSRLVETLTVRAKVVNANGFASGLYSVQTTVTCEQQ